MKTLLNGGSFPRRVARALDQPRKHLESSFTKLAFEQPTLKASFKVNDFCPRSLLDFHFFFDLSAYLIFFLFYNCSVCFSFPVEDSAVNFI